jgi:hypothetical protein
MAGVTTMTALPADLAVQCTCGQCVPLLLFVYDGRPHHQHPCPRCDRMIFLGPPPPVMVPTKVA